MQLLYLLAFFFGATTLKLLESSDCCGCCVALTPPFFATSDHPLPTALLSAGDDVLRSSMMPLSASLRRRRNSSVKWRESSVLEAECTTSVISSASAGKARRDETKSSAVEMLATSDSFPLAFLRTNDILIEVMTKLIDSPLPELFFGINLTRWTSQGSAARDDRLFDC